MDEGDKDGLKCMMPFCVLFFIALLSFGVGSCVRGNYPVGAGLLTGASCFGGVAGAIWRKL